MKPVLLLGAGIAAAVAVFVWRTQHGPEVWHTAPNPGADLPS
ncbi:MULTISPECIES: hypothetical protein [Mycolicibacterium]|jgi:hypothetical protein|nr:MULTISPECIES: hypothetical protein [Mycolicibacterium]MDW5609271.1 hypothetical protein [Mycolicibacterium sp. D5.8-2]WND56845.1 hypothetical protein QQA43_00050 [Mycolicibacterium vanbaalenii]